MRFAWLLVALPVLFLALWPAPVGAQEQTEAQRRASARALFAEGVAFADREEWAEAADRFRRTMELHPTPVVAFNFGSVLIELARFVEASEHLRMTQRFPGAERSVRREAQAMLDEIEPQIGQLRVQVENLPAGAHVERDGNVLTRAEIGVAVPADPGPHVLRLVRAGETLDEQTIELAPGASEVVQLEAEVDLSPVAAAATVETGEAGAGRTTSDGGGGSVVEEWWFWTLIAVVVVGAGLGIGLGVGLSGDGQSADPVPGNLDPGIIRGMVLP